MLVITANSFRRQFQCIALSCGETGQCSENDVGRNFELPDIIDIPGVKAIGKFNQSLITALAHSRQNISNDLLNILI